MKRGRNIHDLSENGCGLDPELRQHSFSVLVWVPLAVAMATVKCHDAGGCVT